MKGKAKIEKAKARARVEVGQEVHFEVDGRLFSGRVRSVDGEGKNPSLRVERIHLYSFR